MIRKISKTNRMKVKEITENQNQPGTSSSGSLRWIGGMAMSSTSSMRAVVFNAAATWAQVVDEQDVV